MDMPIITPLSPTDDQLSAGAEEFFTSMAGLGHPLDQSIRHIVEHSVFLAYQKMLGIARADLNTSVD